MLDLNDLASYKDFDKESHLVTIIFFWKQEETQTIQEALDNLRDVFVTCLLKHNIIISCFDYYSCCWYWLPVTPLQLVNVPEAIEIWPLQTVNITMGVIS